MFTFNFNDMKKLVCKTIACILILSVIILAINAIYKEKTQNDDGTKKFAYVPKGIMISNCGSSHGGDFDYANVEGYTCFNFALASQSLSYDYRVLSYYEDCLAEGGILFIPISYFSLLGGKETEKEGFESINKRYYKFLPREYIKEYSLQTEFFVKWLPALSAYEELFLALMRTDAGQNKIGAADGNHKEYVKQSAEAASDRHLNGLKQDGEWIINEEEIEAVHQIIELCKKKNITPVLITTPFSKEYNEAVERKAPGLQGVIVRNLIDKVAESEKVAYYDYSHDERFYANYDWFMDGDHLSLEGGVQFVDIVMKEIVEALL